MRAAALVLAAALPGAAQAQTALELVGRGVQIFTCAAAGTGFAWAFVAPEATLFDGTGAEAGKHFAGPSWQAPDGSVVAGEALVASSASPGGLPWLVLRAKSHAGAGQFEAVRYIARTQTKGGTAPATGCDAAHAGAESRVAYTALYTLFSAAP